MEDRLQESLIKLDEYHDQLKEKTNKLIEAINELQHETTKRKQLEQLLDDQTCGLIAENE
jgi:hypothetical protein